MANMNDYKLELWDEKSQSWVIAEDRPYTEGLKESIGFHGIELELKARITPKRGILTVVK